MCESKRLMLIPDIMSDLCISL